MTTNYIIKVEVKSKTDGKTYLFKKKDLFTYVHNLYNYTYIQKNTLKLKDINIAHHNILLLVCWKSIIITK